MRAELKDTLVTDHETNLITVLYVDWLGES